ncbi:MAG: hypothetical protein IPI64_06135 [Chloracidobacterium sp.]|nr:hypothetical protein [Chloracidobacterium sp.]
MTNRSITENNVTIHRTAVLCVSLLAVIVVLLPISAGAQCKNWYVGGVWEIKQSGLKYGIIVDLKQNDRVLIGTANISTNLNYGPVKAKGTIDGDNLSLQIFWQDGTVGVYNAKFLSSGRLDGNGYEKKTPNITHIWQSKKQFKCPPPPSFNVPLNTYKGKPKPKPVSSPTKPKTEEPPPPPMKVPGIIATQAIFSHPSAYTGFVVLTWDAGPDHPYAEVWYKVNNGEETFLVEKGKGSRQVPVERYKYYTYILTDAGKTLATINVVGN